MQGSVGTDFGCLRTVAPELTFGVVGGGVAPGAVGQRSLRIAANYVQTPKVSP
jgi:hypothetical protein